MALQKILYLCCYLVLSQLTLRANSELDSLKQVVEIMPADSQKCVTLFRIADLLYHGDVAEFYAQRSLDLAKKLNNPKLIGNAFIKLAFCHSYDEMDKKTAFLDSAVQVFTKTEDIDGLGLAYNVRGIILMNYGSLEEAESALKKAHEFYVAIGNEERQAVLLNNWGISLSMMKKPLVALEKFKVALTYRLQEQPINPIKIARVYNGLGEVNKQLGQLEEATAHYLKSYQYRNQVKNIAVAESLINIAIMTCEAAEKGQDTMLIMERIQAFGFSSSMALIDSAAAYPGVAERAGFQQSILDVRQKWHLLYGNYQQAYELLLTLKKSEEANQLSESSLEAFANLKSQFEKEQLKTRLLEEEIDNRKKENQVNLLILSLGILLSTIIIGTLIYQNRLKAKSILLTAARQEQQLIAMRSMLEGQEKERARIARDLHDGLGNMLSTLKANVGSMQINFNNQKTAQIYSKASEMIDEACTEVRKIAHEMMPQALEKLGLKKALQDLVQKTDANYEFEAQLQIYGQEQILDDGTNVMLYRIVQELLNNIIKYAEAKEVLVQITYSEDWLNLTVEDDGKGFNPTKITSDKSMGLKSIAFRTQYIGGEYEIDSRPNMGTLVSVNVPLKPLVD